MFGISQPVFDVIANKTSKRFVLMLGCVFMGAGLFLIPFCKSFLPLVGALGVVLPIGTGAVSFGMIMSVVSPLVGEKKAIIASGLVNASSGVGGIILSPVIQGLYDLAGLFTTMTVLAVYMIILVFVSAFMCGNAQKNCENNIQTQNTKEILKQALKNKSYLALVWGFFTCGYHMGIVETHLFSQIVSYGISETFTSFAFSVYGAATMTPTSGLTAKLYGADQLATLFGVIFLSHQVGSFLSAWVGGVSVEMTGGYVSVWAVAVVLSLTAAIMTMIIDTSYKYDKNEK